MTPVAYHSSALPHGTVKRALSPERTAKLELDQLRLVEANVQPAAYAMPAFALTLSIMLAAWIPVGHLAYWFIAVCLGSLRYWAFSMDQVHENPQIELLHAWNVMNRIVRGTLGRLSKLESDQKG